MYVLLLPYPSSLSRANVAGERNIATRYSLKANSVPYLDLPARSELALRSPGNHSTDNQPARPAHFPLSNPPPAPVRLAGLPDASHPGVLSVFVPGPRRQRREERPRRRLLLRHLGRHPGHLRPVVGGDLVAEKAHARQGEALAVRSRAGIRDGGGERVGCFWSIVSVTPCVQRSPVLLCNTYT